MFVTKTPKYSPNFSQRPGEVTVDTIVLHATSGPLKPSLDWLTNDASNVSAHWLIDYDGTAYLIVPPSLVAYHAGLSRMPDGRWDVNRFSIGIELVNENDGRDKYPKAQIDTLTYIVLEAMIDYPYITQDTIVTHATVARLAGRTDSTRADFRNDPLGFDMEHFKRDLLTNAQKMRWAVENSARLMQAEARTIPHDWIMARWFAPLRSLEKRLGGG